jgi:hypothetical protein
MKEWDDVNDADSRGHCGRDCVPGGRGRFFAHVTIQPDEAVVGSHRGHDALSIRWAAH